MTTTNFTARNVRFIGAIVCIVFLYSIIQMLSGLPEDEQQWFFMLTDLIVLVAIYTSPFILLIFDLITIWLLKVKDQLNAG